MFHWCRQFILNVSPDGTSATFLERVCFSLRNHEYSSCNLPKYFFKAIYQCLLLSTCTSVTCFCLPYSQGTLNIWMFWNLILFLPRLIIIFTFLQILLKEFCLAVFSSIVFQPCYWVAGMFQALTCELSCPCCLRKNHVLRKAKTARHSCFLPFMNWSQWYLL